MKLLFFLMIEAMLLGLFGGQAHAEEMTEAADTMGEIEDVLSLDEIDKGFLELSETESFSFSDTFRKLLSGEQIGRAHV